MGKKAGEKTGQFGLWLTEYIRKNYPNRDYQVFYDRGDPSQDAGFSDLDIIYRLGCLLT